MTAKKVEEILPPGAVPVDSVFRHEDYVQVVPEIAPFRPNVVDEPKRAVEKSAEKKEG